MGTVMARPTGAARAGFVTMAGGILMILGTLLPFATVSAEGVPGFTTESASGLDFPRGGMFLGFGVGIAVVGLVMLLTKEVVPKILGVLAVLAGGSMLVAGIMQLTGLEQSIAEAAAEVNPGVTADQVLQALRQVGVSVNAGIGLYVVLAGSLISAAGGVWAIVTRTTATPPAPPAPRTGTDWSEPAAALSGFESPPPNPPDHPAPGAAPPPPPPPPPAGETPEQSPRG
jgi:hypothetical protein